MHETATNLIKDKLPSFLGRFGSEIIDATDFRGDLEVCVKPGRIRDMIWFLKSEQGFNMCMDLFGNDYLKYSVDMPERFAVVYNLYSLANKRRVRLKAFVNEDKPEIDSIHDLFKMANWFEREAWDMFGIVFKGHPNLIRILCHTDFVGHPMRKDYPSDQYQRLKNAAPPSGF